MELKIHDQEVLLQRLWKSRKLFNQELRTVNGESIEVVFAGAENLDTGPDFKDAVIKIAGRLLKGDVEVHLNENGWYEHGHHSDPRYNNVILHLISHEPTKQKFIQREDGAPVHQLCIDSEQQKSALWKNNIATEKSEALVVEDCPLSQQSEAKIMATINAAGQRRLLMRTEQLREDLQGSSWEQLIYKKIMEALGYSKNQAPFLKLAETVAYETVCAEMQWVDEEMALLKCAALLFGAAGLLPSQAKSSGVRLDAATLTYSAPLEQLWEQIAHRLEINSMKPHAWQFFRLRPQNFPTRRLAGMVQLIFRFYRQGFLEGFLKIFNGHSQNYLLIINELENTLTIKAEGYWREHYRFGETPVSLQKNEEALIGRERVRDILVNIILPVSYLYAVESSDGALKSTVQEIYTRYPKLSENVITRAMKQQLKMVGEIKFASQQQGLIYLHKLYCRPLRCSECQQITHS